LLHLELWYQHWKYLQERQCLLQCFLPHPSLFSGRSVTGGYVYRGPVPELQGRYFFADFVNGNVYSGIFDTNTNPAAFDGTNLTDVQNHTTSFEALIGGGANIQFVTSFGEDNAGNLYIVKFGGSFFPPLGQGEVFRISPIFSNMFDVQVDRNSGAITLQNTSENEIAFSSLTITSAFGAIDPGALTPITDHYDINGDHSIDGNDAWMITSPAGSHELFREATSGDAGAIEGGEQIILSSAGGWIPSPNEDLFVSLLLDDGAVLNATVSYTGNGGHMFSRGDLDFNDHVDIDDWSIFVAHSHSDLSGLSRAEAYASGDLDGDGDNDYGDFLLFKSVFDAVNGEGAFEAAVLGVPEPSALLLAVGSVAAGLANLRRQRLPRHSRRDENHHDVRS